MDGVRRCKSFPMSSLQVGIRPSPEALGNDSGHPRRGAPSHSSPPPNSVGLALGRGRKAPYGDEAQQWEGREPGAKLWKLPAALRSLGFSTQLFAVATHEVRVEPPGNLSSRDGRNG